MKHEEPYDVVVLGAGFGGLGMAAQLKLAGIENFVLLEKGRGVGGVWRDNTYPGAACDTEAHLYCYGFAPHTGVSRMYAGRDELLAYLENLAKEFNLYQHIRLETEVTGASWDADQSLWHIRSADGAMRRARFFIPAWGQLNTPSIPRFPGLDTFEGDSFHSASWDHAVDLTGKRVVSIGAAASAVQYVPEVAKVAAELTVLQRSANWIMPRNQVVFTQDQLDAFQREPALFEASRRRLHTMREDGFSRTRHGTDAQKEGMAVALGHLADQVPDAELRTLLTPDYEFGCKRILRSDDYYPALMRDNVTLVTDGITGISSQGVHTDNRVLHRADVIIFGTGFASQAFQGNLSVRGLHGVSLEARWESGPEAYLGMTIDGFPNLFMIYGPNTNLNHNSIVTMLELQQRYIIQALHELLPEPGTSVSVRREVLDSFNADLQLEMTNSAFSSDCSSWYKNEAGKVINNWSGTVEEYRQLVSSWDDADYLLTRTSGLVTS